VVDLGVAKIGLKSPSVSGENLSLYLAPSSMRWCAANRYLTYPSLWGKNGLAILGNIIENQATKAHRIHRSAHGGKSSFDPPLSLSVNHDIVTQYQDDVEHSFYSYIYGNKTT